MAKQLRYTSTVPPQPYWEGNESVEFGDSSSLDAFSRLRVSTPQAVFDGQFTYGLQPLIFGQVVSGTGASIAHDGVNRCARMNFNNTASGSAYLQSFEYIRYQPGKSQQIFITFNFAGPAAGVTKFAGYSDGVNGIELQLTEHGARLVVYSGTDNGTEIALQEDWNINPLPGLDLYTTQILVIDLQAFYVGRVRVAFDIDGKIVDVHEFAHANRARTPYLQTASLPVRCGMISEAAGTTEMRFICCAVSSEGGQEEGNSYGFAAASGEVTAASGADTHILTVRPRTTFNGFTNRVKFVLDSVDLLVTGNNPVQWTLAIGQAIGGTGVSSFAAVNETHSAFEVNSTGTISGSPVIAASIGYVAATVQSKSSVTREFSKRYPITLDIPGNHRQLGQVSVIARGLGAGSTMRASLNWKEVR